MSTLIKRREMKRPLQKKAAYRKELLLLVQQTYVPEVSDKIQKWCVLITFLFYDAKPFLLSSTCS